MAIDLAGHGESGSGRTVWTMPAFGADVVAVIEQLGLQDAVLIGHSMGGDVIVEAALALRGASRGLVWVDIYASLGEPRSPDEIETFVRPFRDDFVAATQRIRPAACSGRARTRIWSNGWPRTCRPRRRTSPSTR